MTIATLDQIKFKNLLNQWANSYNPNKTWQPDNSRAESIINLDLPLLETIQRINKLRISTFWYIILKPLNLDFKEVNKIAKNLRSL